jgi:hypothetical protein
MSRRAIALAKRREIPPPADALDAMENAIDVTLRAAARDSE